MLLKNAIQAINDCVHLAKAKGVEPSQIKAVGITNQRETTVVWDRKTGTALYKAILWFDLRTVSTAAALGTQAGIKEEITRITGLKLFSYFSAVKIKWMIEHVPDVKNAVNNGTACFGTVDTWLLWNLSSNRSYLTDVTNAGRTLLMNIRTLEWDDVPLNLIGISRDMLPEIRPCSSDFGRMGDATPLKGTIISGIIGDQQSALVGQACFEPGEAKTTYGTGCFLIVNTGSEVISSNKLLTTPAYKFGDAPCVYSLEGSVAMGGAVIEWLRDNLEIIQNVADIEQLAGSVPDTKGVYFVPAFEGLLAPYWDPYARGMFGGITGEAKKAHFARAALESIAFQVNAVLEAAEQNMEKRLLHIKVDGGASVNNLLMQMQSDITGHTIRRPSDVETTAMGASFVAGHHIGLYPTLHAFHDTRTVERTFEQEIADDDRIQKISCWNFAVQRALNWAQ